MSLRPVIPWRVGLHQSPPPLCRPFSILDPPTETVNHHLKGLACGVCDRVLISRRAGCSQRPGEDCRPLRGMSFLGAITSHGPSRESYTPSRKSRASQAEAIGSPTPDTKVFAQRMRETFSSPASAPALLQRAMPGSGPGMVAMESSAELQGHSGGEKKTERAKLPLPRTCQKPEGGSAGTDSRRDREGNHSGFFSTTAATAPAAMRGSFVSHARPCSDSVHTNAGAPWNAFGSGNGMGKPDGRPGSKPAPADLR
jgi:hypothetical protein